MVAVENQVMNLRGVSKLWRCFCARARECELRRGVRVWKYVCGCGKKAGDAGGGSHPHVQV